MNQCSHILDHMMGKGPISTATARSEYGIKRLSARIKELRDLGLMIELKDGKYSLLKPKPRKAIKRVIEEDDLFPDYEG